MAIFVLHSRQLGTGKIFRFHLLPFSALNFGEKSFRLVAYNKCFATKDIQYRHPA
jgi:hypothetical protein